jgi:hypothetical protein
MPSLIPLFAGMLGCEERSETRSAATVMTERPNRKPNRDSGLKPVNAVRIQQAENPETSAVKVHVTYTVGFG